MTDMPSTELPSLNGSGVAAPRGAAETTASAVAGSGDATGDAGSTSDAVENEGAGTSSAGIPLAGGDNDGRGSAGPASATEASDAGAAPENSSGGEAGSAGSDRKSDPDGSSGSGGSAGADPTDPTETDAVPVDGSISIQDNCPFAACGGELEGKSYKYVGACVERAALIGSLAASCDGLEVRDARGQIEGSLSFANGAFDQDVTLRFSLVIALPPVCAGARCAARAADFLAGGATSASCAGATGGACTCTIELGSSARASTGFSINNDQLALGASRVLYCAGDTGLRYTNTVEDSDYVLRAVER